MRVFPGGKVEIVVPPGTGVPAIERFVARHREWAERRARELTMLLPDSGSHRPSRIELPLVSLAWNVEYQAASRNSVQDSGDGRLVVKLRSDTERCVAQALIRWLTQEAVVHLDERLAMVAHEIGIGYAKMNLRRQRTRWGSCSTAGNISLNVCLMFQRPEVVRYLMIHELCHRRHMNHSTRFWSLVESFEPDWKALDRELLKGWRHVPAWVFP
jgi:hypothetical protein